MIKEVIMDSTRRSQGNSTDLMTTGKAGQPLNSLHLIRQNLSIKEPQMAPLAPRIHHSSQSHGTEINEAPGVMLIEIKDLGHLGSSMESREGVSITKEGEVVQHRTIRMDQNLSTGHRHKGQKCSIGTRGGNRDPNSSYQ